MKKILCMMLATIICLGVLGGCGKDEKKANDLEVAGSEVALTINGMDITVDVYRGFIAQTAINEIVARNPEFSGDFSSVDWNEKVDDKTLADVIKERAMNDLVNQVCIAVMGEDKEIQVTAEDKEQLDQMIEQVKAQGEDILNLALRQTGVTSEEGFRKMYELNILYSKTQDDMGTNRDKYITPELEETLKQFKSDEKVTAQHVLIMNESEKHENPKEVIDEVHKRAVAGEDFNALMTEFNEDPGETAAGYTFGKGEMVPEFEAAAFALDYNQISDVVQSSYGYHVLKRLVGAQELGAYLAGSATVEEHNDPLLSVSVESVMKDVADATNELNNKNGGSNNG